MIDPRKYIGCLLAMALLGTSAGVTLGCLYAASKACVFVIERIFG